MVRSGVLSLRLVCRNVQKDCRVATNLSIDPALLAKAVALSGDKTPATAVETALRAFIAHREQMKLRELFGSLEWSAGLDCKRERTRT